jgi:hypothetical protein
MRRKDRNTTKILGRLARGTQAAATTFAAVLPFQKLPFRAERSEGEESATVLTRVRTDSSRLKGVRNAQCDSNAPRGKAQRSKEEHEWLKGQPVGGELI